MQYYFAPMEGITGFVFRNIHQDMFPGIDRYYMPFIAPHTDGSLKSREKSDTDPLHNVHVNVIPQILSNHAESTITAARRLLDLGYDEVNLNLGCPYPTVVSKGRGAGFLEYPDRLRAYLDEIFAADHMPAVSIKTRLCSGGSAQNDALFSLYSEYPAAELIIHPRRQKDFYKGTPDRELYDHIADTCPLPLCYNGSLYTPQDVDAFLQAHTREKALMIGRGLLRNPALIRVCLGGAPLSMQEFKEFHDRLYQGYSQLLSGPAAILGHMKELWIYWETALQVSPKLMKAVYKSRSTGAYESAVSILMREAQLYDVNSRPVKTSRLSLM